MAEVSFSVRLKSGREIVGLSRDESLELVEALLNGVPDMWFQSLSSDDRRRWEVMSRRVKTTGVDVNPPFVWHYVRDSVFPPSDDSRTWSSCLVCDPSDLKPVRFGTTPPQPMPGDPGTEKVS